MDTPLLPNASNQQHHGSTSIENFLAEFEPGDVGKTVYFMARWQNTRGEFGPWSLTATASVPG